jgi:putative ABC transport system permease protein
MKLFDSFKLSFDSLRHRKLRSWLTIIGIVVGIAAVVALISVAQGVRDSITDELSAFVADTMTVVPGYYKALEEIQFGGFDQGTIGELTENDVRMIKTVPGVLYANAIIYGDANIEYGGQIASTSAAGLEAEAWKMMENLELDSGRYLKKGDGYSAVLGYGIANNLFDKQIQLNRQIKINGKTFRVVGILEEGGFFGTFDTMVFIPKDIAKIVLDTDEIGEIGVKITKSADPLRVATQIENKLLLSHHVTEDDQDFTVITSQGVEETVGSITAMMTLFFGGIAGISLLVGGIGIANTMFMSVMERIREIGILKALGATNSDVTNLFLIESGLIGLVGGAIGIFFGFIATLAITGIGYTNPAGIGIRATLTPELTLFALGFSIFVGIASGIFPARKAAKLQPVEALRYE